jgi:hypothetical protein
MGDKHPGRPRLIPPWYERRMVPHIHTERQHQARYLAHEAMSILGLVPKSAEELPQPTWLVNWDGANRGKQGAVKWAVLEELGRMALAGFGADRVRKLAACPTLSRMNAKQAAATLREMRLRAVRQPR